MNRGDHCKKMVMDIFTGRKFIVFTAAVLLSIPCFCQHMVNWREKIDDMIEQTDSLSMKSQTTFYQVKYLKHDRCIKETWYYTLREGKLVFFQLRYAIDSSEFTETYYVNKNRPICMAKFEEPYLSKSDDINHAEICFFLDNNLRQFVTSGVQKENIRKSDREYECLERFSQRFSELQANLR